MVVKDDCIGRVIKFKGLGWQKKIGGSRVAKCKINLLNEEAKQFLGWGGKHLFRGDVTEYILGDWGHQKCLGVAWQKIQGGKKVFEVANLLQAMQDDESQK